MKYIFILALIFSFLTLHGKEEPNNTFHKDKTGVSLYYAYSKGHFSSITSERISTGIGAAYNSYLSKNMFIDMSLEYLDRANNSKVDYAISMEASFGHKLFSIADYVRINITSAFSTGRSSMLHHNYTQYGQSEQYPFTRKQYHEIYAFISLGIQGEVKLIDKLSAIFTFHKPIIGKFHNGKHRAFTIKSGLKYYFN